MNAILEKVKELAPEYKLPNWHERQAYEPAKSDYEMPEWQKEMPGSNDPVQQIADGIPSRVEAARARLAELVKVPYETVKGEDVMSVITLNRPIKPDYSGLDLTSFASGLTPERLLELGRISGASQEEQQYTDPITMIYREILKRDPEPSGHSYYTSLYNSGVSLSKITWHIENSPEAKSL